MAKELVELGRKTPKSRKVLPTPVKGDLSCKGRDWNHKDSAAKRRSILKCVVTKRLKAQGDACQSGIGRLNLLANLTTTSSPTTHRKARADMAWLRKQDWCKLKSKKK